MSTFDSGGPRQRREWIEEEEDELEEDVKDEPVWPGLLEALRVALGVLVLGILISWLISLLSG